jgi:3-carboxy-cis,cis-muconate cycloisomerase
VKNCEPSQIDWAKLKAKTEQIGYPIIAVVNQINAHCKDKLGEYCHWGATTQDITDTAAVLQIREGLALVEADLAAISASLAKLARDHRDTPIIGRSNLQQATPITFGYKMASILAGIERHRERLARSSSRGCWWASSAARRARCPRSKKGAMETQAGLMKELGLGSR